MENTDRSREQGGQGQGYKPSQGGGQNPGGRQGQGESQDGRPTPSGVPNEGRGTDGQAGSRNQEARQGQRRYKYKGGRQGTGGVPNPDDPDDLESAGSFRGTAEREVGDDDDSERSSGARQRLME
jgi:hypothetical protein